MIRTTSCCINSSKHAIILTYDFSLLGMQKWILHTNEEQYEKKEKASELLIIHALHRSVGKELATIWEVMAKKDKDLSLLGGMAK